MNIEKVGIGVFVVSYYCIIINDEPEEYAASVDKQLWYRYQIYEVIFSLASIRDCKEIVSTTRGHPSQIVPVTRATSAKKIKAPLNAGISTRAATVKEGP